VEKLAREMHLGDVTVSEPALTSLTLYDWPGNVRELENTLARAMVVARGGVIAPEHLSLTGAPATTPPNGGDDESLEAVERAHVRKVLLRTGGNKRQACRILGISRPTLDRMIAAGNLAGDVVNGRDTDSQGS
jgi:DNA-binding NtrC family response regulator